MFKAVIDKKAACPKVLIGLSFDNIARMKEYDPIVFNLSDLQLPDQPVCITWTNERGMAAFPQGMTCIGLAFSSHAFEKMIQGGFVEMATEVAKFLVFAGKDEHAIHAMIRKAGFIKSDTQSTFTGFDPSEKPQSMN